MNKSGYLFGFAFLFAWIVAGCLWPVQEQSTLQRRVADATLWVNTAMVPAQNMKVPANTRVEIAYKNGTVQKEEGPADLVLPQLTNPEGFICHIGANGAKRETRCFSYDYWITLQRYSDDTKTYCFEWDGSYADRDQSDEYVPAQSCQALGFVNGGNGRYYK